MAADFFFATAIDLVLYSAGVKPVLTMTWAFTES
jgi:hypothetical protein